MPRLRFLKPGPSTVLRPEFPNVPNGGIENAVVLNQRSSVRSSAERLGSPLTFGRSLKPNPRFDRPVLLASMSGCTATVKGRPLFALPTTCTCQSFTHALPEN